VSFLRPVRPDRIVAKGRVVQRDGDLAFLEASLVGADAAIIATARVIALRHARAAA
jgi:acyl-coenzyme A thioesterase PaaI-like protein